VEVEKQTFKVELLEQPTKVIEAATKLAAIFLALAAVAQEPQERTLVQLAVQQVARV
jgi:hypothetical protein